jgi:pimeloyl-ACP methyl ester carboxylesterase
MVFVLVHGGGFAGSCWDLLTPHLEQPSLAVDLPGRGNHPGGLDTATAAAWATSVVADIDAHFGATEKDIVLVGHSMAGLTVPRVMGLIPDRISRTVFVSCSVPAQGTTLLDGLKANFDDRISERADEARSSTDTDADNSMPADLAVAMFCNDMDPELTSATLAMMVPEAATVLNEPADITGLKQPIPRTWVRLMDDAIVSVATQDMFIAQIPDVDVIDLDAGHMAMISRPKELADILNQLVPGTEA